MRNVPCRLLYLNTWSLLVELWGWGGWLWPCCRKYVTGDGIWELKALPHCQTPLFLCACFSLSSSHTCCLLPCFPTTMSSYHSGAVSPNKLFYKSPWSWHFLKANRNLTNTCALKALLLSGIPSNSFSKFVLCAEENGPTCSNWIKR